MKFRQIDDSPQTFILVFETGDELTAGLLNFAKKRKLSAASFKVIGALSSVRLGWLSWESKKYEPSVTLDEQVELLSLIGDVGSRTTSRWFMRPLLSEGRTAQHTADIYLKLAFGLRMKSSSQKARRICKSSSIPSRGLR